LTSGKAVILSLPQNRESRKVLKIPDFCVHGNDKIIFLEPLSKVSPFSLDKGKGSWLKWFGFESPRQETTDQEERQDLIQLTINELLQEG
jgi:hypothetical protein